jgi:CubicO group peptidase (beta-lactamase class C family)
MQSEKINKLFEKVTSSSKVKECLLLIENTDGSLSCCKEYNRTVDTPMLMASVTKLFTTACILALLKEEKLSLEDKIANYLEEDLMESLHVYKKNDYSFDLTIAHLLYQTSGLPDFFLDGAGAIFSKVKERDFAYSYEDELGWIKSMEPIFAPGTKSKAYYTDANFDLLGKIIEVINGSTLQQAYSKYIFEPLELKHTYLATGQDDYIPHTYYKSEKMERPLFIRSSYASGGGITTARELMIFIKAFYSGKLFDQSVLSRLTISNPLQLAFFPIHYAGGYMTVKVSYPFGKKYTLMGHSGSTGSFAFYCPEKDLFFVGDAPLIDSPVGTRLVMRAALNIS